jgi:hypothetical protein
MPFLCLQTAAIPDGVLQVTDMSPNESQRSELQGDGQTRYINRVQNDTVEDSLANQIRTVLNVGGCQGLAAYIIDNVDAGGGGGGAAATATQANAAAIAIIAIMDAGTVCRKAEIDAELIAAGIANGTTIDGGGSEGVVAEVLSILSGRGYVVPVGSEVQVAGAKVPRTGTFTPQRTSRGSVGGPNPPAPVIVIDLEDKGIRQQVLSASLLASAGVGEISGFELTRDLNAMSVIQNDTGIPATEEVNGVQNVDQRTFAPPFARAKLAKNRFTPTLNQTVLVLYANDGTIIA